jgi:hypothetical protein
MKKRWLQFLPETLCLSFMLAIMAFVYGQVVSTDAILSFDDDLLLDPLLKLDSLTGYFQALFANRVLDLQPVRDLSYLFDIQLMKRLPFWSYHMGNLLVWLAVCLVYWRILSGLVESRIARNATILLVALHPVMALSISWIAARKHLLSALFIGLATWLLLRRPKESGFARALIWGLGCSLFYGLAVFSQPIAILWPFWAVLWLFFEGKGAFSGESFRRGLFLLPAFLLMAICFKLNWDYYSGPYLVHTGATKITRGFDVSDAALAIGRYVYNLVIPSTITVAYYQGATQNVIGLGILPALVWVLAKTIQARTLLVWGTFVVFPLAAVIERQANIFVSDTYLAIPMLGVAVLVSTGASGLVARFPSLRNHNRVFAALGVLLIGLYSFESKSITRGFLSSEALWDWASSVEKTPFSLSQQVLFEMKRGNDQKAVYLAQFFYNWTPNHLLAPRTLGAAVNGYKGWSDDEKIRFLKERWSPDPWLNYFLAGILAKTGNFEKAYSIARNVAPRALELEQSAEGISAEITFICKRAKGTDCDLIEQQFMKSTAQRVLPWRHSEFESRMKGLLAPF